MSDAFAAAPARRTVAPCHESDSAHLGCLLARRLTRVPPHQKAPASLNVAGAAGGAPGPAGACSV
jgi:hypothetical protein